MLLQVIIKQLHCVVIKPHSHHRPPRRFFRPQLSSPSSTSIPPWSLTWDPTSYSLSRSTHTSFTHTLIPFPARSYFPISWHIFRRRSRSPTLQGNCRMRGSNAGGALSSLNCMQARRNGLWRCSITVSVHHSSIIVVIIHYMPLDIIPSIVRTAQILARQDYFLVLIARHDPNHCGYVPSFRSWVALKVSSS